MPATTYATSSARVMASSSMRRGRSRSILIWPRGGQIHARWRWICRLRPPAAPEPRSATVPGRGGDERGFCRLRPATASTWVVSPTQRRPRDGDDLAGAACHRPPRGREMQRREREREAATRERERIRRRRGRRGGRRKRSGGGERRKWSGGGESGGKIGGKE